MDKDTKELWENLRKGNIDVNNQQLFFSIVAKGFIYKLNQNLRLRGKGIPHYILNTGDDIMYLEVKGQDHSVEPVEVTNEDFMYSQVPRCMIQPTGINVQMDQLSNPYSHGKFEVEYNDMVYDFRAEFRRIPVTYGFSLKYYVDSFTDSLDIIQQIIANLSFINVFKVIYLGQQINCSYQIPESYQTEYMMEFDGITQESKYRTISLELEVSTNFPTLHPETIIPSNAYFREAVVGVYGVDKKPANNGNDPGDESNDGDNNNPGNTGGNDVVGDDKNLVFRHGLILHNKGGLYTSRGEISDK